ncbi:MAG TPA: flagellar protein FliS [Terracidiphilus sp.]|nr:flagellar protein FliS [Terracidiphilus sp.]
MRTDLAYRKTAVQGSSGFGLLIAIFDALAEDLRRAAQAERNNDLERRCLEANHAVQIIGFLEDRLLHGEGGDLATRLRSFYRGLRQGLMQAQINRSPEQLDALMNAVLKIREAWQKADQQRISPRADGLQATMPNPAAFAEATASYGRDDWFA